MDSGLKISLPSIKDWLSKCLQETDKTERMTKGIPTLIQKEPPQSNRPQQLHTYKVPTDDVEYTKGTN